MKLLFVNACARKESRTYGLAQEFLKKWENNYEITHLNLYEEEFPLLDETEIEMRGIAAAENDMANPYVKYATQFKDADIIVMAAPFWDMGFPALLKTYIETIMMTGITFTYGTEGYPIGLCQAKKLLYITTAGGPIPPVEFGYSYVKFLAENMWGIRDCQCVKAEGLDIVGADVEGILAATQAELSNIVL